MKISKNIWTNSKALKILKAHQFPKIAFLDIDLTMSGNPVVAVKIREKLKELGYVTVFVTSRTEEMVMSKREYGNSKQFGFSRAQPKLEIEDDGKMVHAFIDEIPSQKGLYDPEIIVGTTGSSILVGQEGGGYWQDEDFMGYIGESSKNWRSETLQIVKKLDPDSTFVELAPVDKKGNYEKGIIDVEQPDYRIQLNVVGDNSETALANKIHFFGQLVKIRDERKLNIRITDDSYPSFERYSIYLTPFKVWKATAAQHIIDKIIEELELRQDEIETFFAGDGYPDMRMGLESGIGTKGTFLIVGGSRLSDVLLGETEDFAGITLEDIRKRMKEVGRGRYIYEVNEKDTETPILEREVIIGDVAFQGTKGPETILAYLESQRGK